MLRRKDRNSAELKTVRISKSPTTVVAANGEVHAKEEATVHVKELDLFVTVKLLDDTATVLSHGKFCQDHGYSYEWTTGQKPQLIEDGRRIKCNTAKHVPIVVPGPTSVSQEAEHSASTSTESSSGTVWRNPSHEPAETEKTKTWRQTRMYGETRCLICQNGMQRFCSLPRRLVGFHHTTMHCFELLLMAIVLMCVCCVHGEFLKVLCRLDQ